MSEQICLKWNSFLNNIATSFESLWEDESLVDVTLTSDGQFLTAHKLILSSSSPFFKKVFQTNRSQHPVIVFQDIHFSELQALLVFIYKGEVNIDQKKLPALLKAAETLQIRGLSGGDILDRDCYTRLDELEQSASDETVQPQCAAEPRRKKKKKVSDPQEHGNQVIDKILIPRIARSLSRASESSSSDKGVKDGEGPNDTTNSSYRQLGMKLEPIEVVAEDLQKYPNTNNEKDRSETGHSDGDQGPSSSSPSFYSKLPSVSVIAEALLLGNSPMNQTLQRIRLSNRFFDESSKNDGLDDVPVFRVNSPKKADEPQPEDKAHSPSNSSEVNARAHSHNEHQPNHSQSSNEVLLYPPFPCPFCDRAYTSWGFRRRHIKAVHTVLPELNCKWCLEVLPSHAAWARHVISVHNLTASDARNGLLILEEAHMVLQIAQPTRLETMVNIAQNHSKSEKHSD